MLKRYRSSIAVLLALVASPAIAKDHLEVSLGDVSLQKIPFIIAEEAGIYAKNGLDVHQFITDGAAKAAKEHGIVVPAANVGGSYDSAQISVGGGAPLVASVVKTDGSVHHRIILATNEAIVRDHIISRADIKTEADLKGKRLGSGRINVTGYAGIAYLERIGMTNDVTIVDTLTLQSIKDGQSDAVMANLFSTARAPEMGLRDLVDVSKYNIPEAGSGVSADPDWIAAHRDIAKRFLISMVQATALMKSDHALFTRVMKKWYNVTDEKMIDRVFQLAQGMPDKPYPSVPGISKAIDIFGGANASKFKATNFYDDSLMKELDREGYLGK